MKGIDVSDDMTAADQQILTILAKLQETLGDDFSKLETHEIEAIRAILFHSETLVEIAKYEEAKGLFWAYWRKIILALSALLAALGVVWASVSDLASRLAKVFL